MKTWSFLLLQNAVEKTRKRSCWGMNSADYRAVVVPVALKLFLFFMLAKNRVLSKFCEIFWTFFVELFRRTRQVSSCCEYQRGRQELLKNRAHSKKIIHFQTDIYQALKNQIFLLCLSNFSGLLTYSLQMLWISRYSLL